MICCIFSNCAKRRGYYSHGVYCLILCCKTLTLFVENLSWYWVAEKLEHDIEFTLLWVNFREKNNYYNKWSWLREIRIKWNPRYSLEYLAVCLLDTSKQDNFLAWNYYAKLYQKNDKSNMSNVNSIQKIQTTIRESAQGPNQTHYWHLQCRTLHQHLVAKSHELFFQSCQS